MEFSLDDHVCLAFGWIAQSELLSRAHIDDDEVYQEAIKILPEKISFDECEFDEHGFVLDRIEFVDESGQPVDSDEEVDIIKQISKSINWKPVI